MAEKKIPYKIYLEESEMPQSWYNVRADMKNKPAPLLNPATLKPMTAEELAPVFCDELIAQELGPIVWRKSFRPRRRSTTSLKETTPAAAISSTPPSRRPITPRSRA